MKKLIGCCLVCFMAVSLFGCNAQVEDTAVEDTAVEDTAVEDAAVEDTAEEDAAEEEVAVAVSVPALTTEVALEVIENALAAETETEVSNYVLYDTLDDVNENLEFISTKRSGKDQHYAIVLSLEEDESVVLVHFIDAIVSGVYPDAASQMVSYTVIFSYQDGAWYLDVREATTTAVLAMPSFETFYLCTQGAVDAHDAGRMCYQFGNYAKFDNSVVYQGTATAEIVEAYVDENGDLNVLVLYLNGVDYNVAFTSTDFTLMYSDTGTVIIDESSTSMVSVLANTSQLMHYTVPAEQVNLSEGITAGISSNVNCKTK